MSSLRLALKQSLQETGHLAPKEKKKRKKKKAAEAAAAARQNGTDRPRKRGRPPKHPRPTSPRPTAAESDALGNGDEARPLRREEEDEEEEATYSSENEFSYESDEEEEEDDGDEEDGEVHEDGNDQEDNEDANSADPKQQREDGEERQNLDEARIRSDEASDEERRKERKLLKKQLKHCAANKIQSQWKKSKKHPKGSDGGGGGGKSTSTTMQSEDKKKKEEDHESPNVASAAGEDATLDAAGTSDKKTPMKENSAPNSTKKKRQRKHGPVPAPVPEVLEWSRGLPNKKSRRNVAKGMRVKVRFTTEVMKDGKVAKKKKWFGGRVSAASGDRTKIKIKYDDGTTEVAEFPDKDVVVDDTGNGHHLEVVQDAASKFVPPSFREKEVDEEFTLPPEKHEEKKEPEDSKQSSSEPPVEEQEEQVEKQEEKQQQQQAEADEETSPPVPVANVSGEKEAKPVETIETPMEVEEGETTSDDPNVAETKVAPAESSNGETDSARKTSPVAEPAEEAKPEDAAKPKEEATAEAVSTAGKQKDDVDSNEKKDKSNQSENRSSSKPSLTIRISKVKQSERAAQPETPREDDARKTHHDYSSEEELHADTPVTERQVRSIKMKRKRPTNNASPSSSSPDAKKHKPNEDTGSKEDVNDATAAVADGDSEKPAENLPRKGSTTISISLKGAERHDAPLIPDLPKLNASGEPSDDNPTVKPRNSPVPSRESPEPMKSDLVMNEKDNAIIKPVATPATAAEMEVADSAEVEPSKVVVGGSIGSAFGQSPKPSDDAESKEDPTMSVGTTPSLPRTGRRTSEETKGKTGAKQDAIEKDAGRRKKKRKRKEGKGSDAEGSDEDDRQWVQCDKCKKWRILPSRVQAASLPDKWFCNLNTYDPKHNDCSAPEQTVKQVAKEWRRARKRVKQQRLEQAALDSRQDDSTKEDSSKAKGAKSSVSSPKPPKVVVAGRKGDNATKRSSPVESIGSAPTSEVTPDPPKGKKRGRKPKKEKEEMKVSEVGKAVDPATEITPKKPGRKRGRPARNASNESTRVTSNEKKDDDNVEWVQCEKCEKWRKLPPYMSADELPDVWYCSMNTWNPEGASCETAEEKADAHHQEVGVFGNIPQGHAGKYTYRSMIYGTGRKQNRPMSEKARAAESLFQRPSAADGHPQTSVLYAKSSMFLPRTSNFHKTQVVEEKSTNIFDILSESELWAELQSIGQPMEFFPDGSSMAMQQQQLSYETLPDVMKETMREVVLQALGSFVLTGEDVVLEAQRFPWESLPNAFSLIRAYVNADIIITTLLALVKDGLVEMTCFKDMSKPMYEWIPRYRRVVQKPKRDVETEEALKASKCMKISKPWKKVDDSSTEWITGGN